MCVHVRMCVGGDIVCLRVSLCTVRVGQGRPCEFVNVHTHVEAHTSLPVCSGARACVCRAYVSCDLQLQLGVDPSSHAQVPVSAQVSADIWEHTCVHLSLCTDTRAVTCLGTCVWVWVPGRVCVLLCLGV